MSSASGRQRRQPCRGPLNPREPFIIRWFCTAELNRDPGRHGGGGGDRVTLPCIFTCLCFLLWMMPRSPKALVMSQVSLHG